MVFGRKDEGSRITMSFIIINAAQKMIEESKRNGTPLPEANPFIGILCALGALIFVLAIFLIGFFVTLWLGPMIFEFFHKPL